MTDHTGAPEVAGRVPRLTAAQRRMLFDISMMSEIVDEKYEPALDLVQMKLAKKRPVPGSLIRVTITATGRAALAAMEKQDG